MYIEAEDSGTAINMASSVIKKDLAEALPSSRHSWESLVLKVDSIDTLDFDCVNENAKGFTFF